MRAFLPQIVYTPGDGAGVAPLVGTRGQHVTVYRNAALTQVEVNLQLSPAGTPLPDGRVLVDATSRTPRLQVTGGDEVPTVLYAKPDGSTLGTPLFSNAEEALARLESEIAKFNATASATYAAKAKLPINVKDHGAVGDGVADDTAAVLAAVAALNQSSGGEIFFPSGTYKIATTINLGNLRGIKLRGAGRPGQRSGTGLGNTVILFSGTGYAIQWGVGSVSTLFTGITIENLHVVGSGISPQGGIRLGNASNSLIRDVTVSDISRADLTGTGFRIDGSTASQYNTFQNCCASGTDIGLDAADTNGLRVFGGLFEDNTEAPRAGTKGIWFRGGSEAMLFGVVVQGWAVLVDIDCPNVSATGCRMEGFITAAYRVSAPQCSIIGGQINNFIAGAVGTGILIAAGVASTTVVMPAIGSVAATINDGGTRTTLITDAGAILGNSLVTKPKSSAERSLEVRSAAGQTAPIQVWADQNGTPVAFINADFSHRAYFTGLGGGRTLEAGAPDSAGAGFRSVRIAN